MPLFVFNNILASFVLFLVFFGSRFSPVPGLLRFSSGSEACPRQCVHKMTTTIGYHTSRGLSSEKCGEAPGRGAEKDRGHLGVRLIGRLSSELDKSSESEHAGAGGR